MKTEQLIFEIENQARRIVSDLRQGRDPEKVAKTAASLMEDILNLNLPAMQAKNRARGTRLIEQDETIRNLTKQFRSLEAAANSMADGMDNLSAALLPFVVRGVQLQGEAALEYAAAVEARKNRGRNRA